jgi:hypothetical protein
MKTFSNHDVLLGLSGIVDHLYDHLAQDRWFRFDTQTREFKCLSEDGSQEMRLTAQGPTKADLTGELGPLIALPAYQLALPFSRATWREMTPRDSLTDTTL